MHPQSTSRQQFVRVCDCGCGQPTLLATKTDPRGRVEGQPLRFINHHHTTAEHNPRWRGGRYQIGTGYVVVFAPDHPHATVRGTIFEHRLVMEAVLGRYLTPDEVVHHKDCNRANNDPANLEVLPRAAHPSRHAGLRWSRLRDACIDCDTTERPHEGGGRCKRCYQHWRYTTDPEWRQHLLDKQKQERQR